MIIVCFKISPTFSLSYFWIYEFIKRKRNSYINSFLLIYWATGARNYYCPKVSPWTLLINAHSYLLNILRTFPGLCHALILMLHLWILHCHLLYRCFVASILDGWLHESWCCQKTEQVYYGAYLMFGWVSDEVLAWRVKSLMKYKNFSYRDRHGCDVAYFVDLQYQHKLGLTQF